MHSDKQSTSGERLEYHAPTFRVAQLALITLGGTIAAGDSGGAGSEGDLDSVSEGQDGEEGWDW